MTGLRPASAARAPLQKLRSRLKITIRPVDLVAVKKVLVVDDSETIRLQVRKALTAEGYEVIEAVDGQDGLDQLRAVRDIRAVLCDVNMPRMTGIEFVAKAQGDGATPPIVMLTSEGQPSLIRRARDLGAKGWIVKPFKVEQLVAAMNRITAGA